MARPCRARTARRLPRCWPDPRAVFRRCAGGGAVRRRCVLRTSRRRRGGQRRRRLRLDGALPRRRDQREPGRTAQRLAGTRGGVAGEPRPSHRGGRGQRRSRGAAAVSGGVRRSGGRHRRRPATSRVVRGLSRQTPRRRGARRGPAGRGRQASRRALRAVRGTSFAAPIVAGLLARELPEPDAAARDRAVANCWPAPRISGRAGGTISTGPGWWAAIPSRSQPNKKQSKSITIRSEGRNPPPRS